MARENADDAGHVRRRQLHAILAISTWYGVVMGLALGVVVEAHHWGSYFTTHQASALRDARNVHVAMAAVLGCLLLLATRCVSPRPWMAKLAMAMMPIALTGSVDRLLAVFFEPIYEHSGLFISHPTRGWTLRPGWSGQDGRAFSRINHHGFRGPDFSLEKKSGERRILFLGDSVTYGSGVAEEDAFVALLRKRMQDSSRGKLATLVNASIPAYSTWQEYDLLVDQGMKLDPDLIVHMFCLNDVLEKFQLEQFGGYTRGFEPPRLTALEWSGCYRAARAWHAMRHKLSPEQLRKMRYNSSVSRLLSDPDAPEVREGWHITLENTRKILATAAGRSVPYILICTPCASQLPPFGPGDRPPQSILKDFAATRGVAFLDLTKAFRTRIDQRQLQAESLFLDRLHLSPDGHKLAAELIEAFLSE